MHDAVGSLVRAHGHAGVMPREITDGVGICKGHRAVRLLKDLLTTWAAPQ